MYMGHCCGNGEQRWRSRHAFITPQRRARGGLRMVGAGFSGLTITGIWLVDISRSEDVGALLLSWTLFRFRLLMEAFVPPGDKACLVAAAALWYLLEIPHSPVLQAWLQISAKGLREKHKKKRRRAVQIPPIRVNLVFKAWKEKALMPSLPFFHLCLAASASNHCSRFHFIYARCSPGFTLTTFRGCI